MLRDDNDGGGSSPQPGAEPQSEGDNAGSPPDAGGQPDDQKTLAEVGREAFEKATKAEPSDVPERDKTEQGKEEPQAPPEEEQPPFHEHPRWKEVVGQRNDLKKKIEEYEPKVKEWEPLVKQQRSIIEFCSNNGVTEQDFQSALNIAALIRQDPAQARAALKPIWDSLTPYDAEALPPEVAEEIQGLRQRVEEGEMSEAAAQRMEKLLRDSAAAQAKVNGSQHHHQATAQQRQQAEQKAIYDAIASWQSTKQGSDPDFKPKSDAEGIDCLYEVTTAKFVTLNQMNPPRTQADVIRNLETAYTSAKKLFTERLKPAATRPAPNTLRSSQSARTEPKTMREAAAAAAAKHGVKISVGA